MKDHKSSGKMKSFCDENTSVQQYEDELKKRQILQGRVDEEKKNGSTYIWCM